MLTASSRLRDWGVFFAAALLPALAMGLFALRALEAEEVAVREQMRLRLEAAAQTTLEAWRQSLERLRDDPAARAPFAEVVEIVPEPEDAPSPAPGCDDLADGVRRGDAQAIERVLKTCPLARTPNGRLLWPLVALAPNAGTDEERLSRWLTAHAGELGAAERAAVRNEIAAAAWLSPPARERVIAALEAQRAASAERFALARRLSMLAGETPIDWADARSVGRLRRQDDGSYRGFVVHAGSLGRAINEGWPPLEPDLAAGLVLTGTAPDGPSVTLLPGGAHLAIGWRDPRAVAQQTAREKRLLLGAAALATLVAIALAGLLFARMRTERRLGALRTDFVAAVSHELRTPIASLRMLSELIAEDRVEPEERDEIHRALVGEARRLGETVDRLLAFSRLEAGRKSGVEAARLDVGSIIDEVAATFRLRHPEARVVTSVEPELTVDVDPESLKMALTNLLENARKYAPDGQPYRIEARRKKRGSEIAVIDRGPGIARRDQKRIFRPFERAADRLSEATEGSGIGLSLVAHVARSHGGELRLESELGRGASFILWFPSGER